MLQLNISGVGAAFMKNKTFGSIKTGDLGALRKRNKELILHTLSNEVCPR